MRMYAQISYTVLFQGLDLFINTHMHSSFTFNRPLSLAEGNKSLGAVLLVTCIQKVLMLKLIMAAGSEEMICNNVIG